MEYIQKEVVWAKVQGSPWWPAKITKLPTKQIPFYKVQFIGQDTHAHLDVKFIKHYQDQYDKLASKKSKKLQNAITKANQMHKNSQPMLQKQRQKHMIKQVSSKSDNSALNNRRNSGQGKFDASPKHYKKSESKRNRQNNRIKNGKKRFNNKAQKQSDDDQSQQEKQQVDKSSQSINSSQQSNYIEQITEENGIDNISQDFMASTEKENQMNSIDRNKIDKVQNQLLNFIHKIQEDEECIAEQAIINYINNFDAQCFTPQELCQSKITKMIAYLLKKTVEVDEQRLQDLKNQLSSISRTMKDKVITHLNNTDYYDNCIRQINRARNQKAQFQKKITIILKRLYSIKKQLAKLFAQRISASIGNYPELKNQFLVDLKEKRLESISNITSKISVERVAEEILNHYQ